ncbi:hypothetical protein DSM104299_05840 [Baekduia alba]|uniref:hypothetical protein n=1 Tax=Baekduia alba TaxID=2997333 RepID=UPI0023418506|nr:hypothetical protein [Baekduia alba]WCB97068.1 hypothetical protein DSM104299_05840 [Baekduia alba]
MSPPRFDRLRVPGEEDARRRALAVARAALAERPATASRVHGPSRALAVALAAVLVATILALGLTAPGRATAEWVGTRLSELTGRDPQPAPHRSASRYAPLPGGGRLLAVADQGLFGFGLGAAPRELLGPVDAAGWSPHGRFAIAARGRTLVAVDVHGRRRWTHTEDRAIRWPTWSPSGFRVAYRAGRDLDVIAGDGTGAHVLAASGPVRPAWQPATSAERLATVDAAARVTLRDVDSGRVLWRVRVAHGPRGLAWSAGGRRLFVLGRDRVITLDGATGRRRARTPRATGSVNVAIASRPGGRGGYAVIRRRATPPAQTEVALQDGTVVLADPGAIRAIAWSPHGDWLAADRPGVDGWDLIGLRGRTVDRARTLAAGRAARLSGWCCG